MTREVLSSYPSLELPTIGGDASVWGQVLNQTLQSLDDYIKANENNVTTLNSSLTTINANDQTAGSTDYKIAQAVAGLRGNSTATFEDLEDLIGEAGNIDLSSYTAAIAELQANLGHSGSQLSTSVYARATANTAAINTLIGGTVGDDTKSVRTICGEVIGSSNTGITETYANTLINNAVGAIQGNTTQTISDLLSLITALTSRVTALEQAVTNLTNNKANQTDVTALNNTVYGTQSITGLVSGVTTATTTANSAYQKATQAQSDVNAVVSNVTSNTSRIANLESAGYITAASLSPYLTSYAASQTYITPGGVDTKLTNYATQNYVLTRGFLTSVPAGYATEYWVTNNFQGLGSSSSYVSTSDTNWKKVRGMFEGVEDTNRTLPSRLYLKDEGSTASYKNSYLRSMYGIPQWTRTFSNNSTESAYLVWYNDLVYKRTRAMLGFDFTWSNFPDRLYIRPFVSNTNNNNKYIFLTSNADNSSGQAHLKVYEYNASGVERTIQLVNGT